MNDFLALAERAWHGQLDLMFEHHPVHSAYDGAVEIVPGILVLKGIACIYIIDSGDGLLMLDAGSVLDTQRTFEEVRKWRPDAPLKLVVFSHHHVDHIFAVPPFTEEAAQRGWPAPQVIAHRATPAHFDRYIKTGGWNTAINRRQFAIHAPNFHWPDKFYYPDITYDHEYQCTLGELDIHLQHARGETDDHTWTWIPQHKLVMTGDLFIWAMPNAGNPQKVQRYVSDWADSLRAMANLQPEILLPGHGFPIFGQDRITQALRDTAELLENIEQQVVAAMNRGLTLDAVYQSVEMPRALLQKPYLQPIYDDAHFLIRMIWRRYGGWWDGEYDTLLPASKADQAKAWVALAGGVSTVVARALTVLDDQPAVAAHLIETALHAQPDDPEVHSARATIYRTRSAAQRASMARNIFNHAALSSDAGVRDLASRENPQKS